MSAHVSEMGGDYNFEKRYKIGSHKAYVRHIIGPAVAPAEEGGLGYRAMVVNF